MTGNKARCPVCGKAFEQRRPDQKYCSHRCAARWSYTAKVAARRGMTAEELFEEQKAGGELATCRTCGATFRRSRYTPGRQYCSAKCGERWRAARLYSKKTGVPVEDILCRRGHRMAASRDALPTPAARAGTYATCRLCGKLFKPARRGQKCCSHECRNIWHNAVNRARDTGRSVGEVLVERGRWPTPDGPVAGWKPRPRQEATPGTKTCAVCGVEFVPGYSGQFLCSIECKRWWQHERHCAAAGEPCPPWDTPRRCEACGDMFVPSRPYQRACCDECAAMLADEAFEAPPPTHRCVDCGRPTPDHRCPKCLEKWRRKHHVRVDVDDGEDAGPGWF